MTITEATLTVSAIIAIISALWRAYRAIERQAYQRARAETRLDAADAALSQMTRERDELDEDLERSRAEITRLHGRIRTLEGVLTRLSQGRQP